MDRQSETGTLTGADLLASLIYGFTAKCAQILEQLVLGGVRALQAIL